MRNAPAFRLQRTLLLAATAAMGFALLVAGRRPAVLSRPAPPAPPPLTTTDRFPCLRDALISGDPARFVILKGPDWRVGTLVRPGCLPERELIFQGEEGERFLSRPVSRRTRLWVTEKDGLTHVRLLLTSGSEQADHAALDLLTGHNCGNRSSRCRVETPGEAPVFYMHDRGAPNVRLPAGLIE